MLTAFGTPWRLSVGRVPDYNGVVVTEDKLLVIDGMSRNLQLYRRRDGKRLYTSHRLESTPMGVCFISKTEIAVCLYSKIVLLSFKSIDDLKSFKTLAVGTVSFSFHSVAKFNSSDKLFVSGLKKDDNDDWILYWFAVNLTDGDGGVDSSHKVCKGDIRSNSHLAIKGNTIYISCWTRDCAVNGVYAYDILYPHTRKFLYQHHGLRPWSIMVDEKNFIFVCYVDCKRIHQLTDSGQLVTIHTVSSRPYEIFYDDQRGVLYTTRYKSNEITVYKLDYSH